MCYSLLGSMSILMLILYVINCLNITLNYSYKCYLDRDVSLFLLLFVCCFYIMLKGELFYGLVAILSNSICLRP